MSADRSASVLARLLNRSRSTGENYNLLLSRFAIERLELSVLRSTVGLDAMEGIEVGDGVVDACSGQHGVELAPVCGGVVLGEDGFDHLRLGQSLARLGRILSFRLVVVDMEAQDVAVFDGVGNGVLVSALVERPSADLVSIDGRKSQGSPQ